MENRKFAAALIDSSVIEDLEYDFLGINSAVLPALYHLIEQKETALLDCNVLHQKIKSSVCKSKLIAELQQLCSFCDGLDMLKSLGDEVDKSVNVIKSIDLHNRFLERFEQLYQNAITMPTCNNNDVITLYYSKLSPFDNTGEDFTMADAFVLVTIMDYAKNHANERFLVITHNDDWEKILGSVANITVVRSAEHVLETWLPEKGLACQLYKKFQQKIKEQIHTTLKDRSYVVGNIGNGKITKYFANDIWIENSYMSPVLIKDNKAVYSVCVDIELDGMYERSFCLYEDDRCECVGASCSVNFQVEITYEIPEIWSVAKLTCVKVVDCGAITVYVDCDDYD